jgi:hypothetical protein
VELLQVQLVSLVLQEVLVGSLAVIQMVVEVVRPVTQVQVE